MTRTGWAQEAASRLGIFGAAGLLVLGLILGWGSARWTEPKLDPDQIRNPAEMEEAVRFAMSESSAFLRSRKLIRVFSGLNEGNVQGAVRGMRTRSEFLDPVDVQVFLTNMKDDFPTFNKLYAEEFADNQPTRTTMEINCLPTPIAVEFKVTAEA